MLGGCASMRLEHASTTGAVYIEDWRGLAPGCLVAQLVGISWLWRLKSDATGSIPPGWVRGVTWVPIFLYSSTLTSLRKENHLENTMSAEHKNAPRLSPVRFIWGSGWVQNYTDPHSHRSFLLCVCHNYSASHACIW